MTLVLVAALVAVAIAHIWLLDRKDKRERAERAGLLQRIQAPQAAVTAHHIAETPPAEPVSPFPMSDAEIAADQEKNRLIAWMEAVENGASPLEEPVE